MVVVLLLLGLVCPSARAERGPDTIVLNVAGDIGYPSQWGKTDYIDARKQLLFAEVQPILDSADLSFANLECPFTKRLPRIPSMWPISCEPARLSYPVEAGFNLFSLANNHAGDAGTAGLLDTLHLLERTNRPDRPLWWTGTGQGPAEAQRSLLFTPPGKHHQIALFAVASSHPRGPVGSVFDRTLKPRITAAAEQADLVLVSVHLGTEFVHLPQPETIRFYRELIDAGADVVIGHHPHVVQGVERYKEGFIFYSLGNFSFGAMATGRKLDYHGWRMYSLMGRLTFVRGALRSVELIPLYVHNQLTWRIGRQALPPRHATPQLLSGDFAAYVLDEIDRFSAAIPGAGPLALRRHGDRSYLDLQGEPSYALQALRRQQQAQEQRAVIAAGHGPRPATAEELAVEPRPIAQLRDHPTQEWVYLQQQYWKQVRAAH